MSQQQDDSTDIKRWTARRKASLVLEILKGQTTSAEAARQHSLTVAEVEQWREDFLSQGTEALRAHPLEPRSVRKLDYYFLRRFSVIIVQHSAQPTFTNYVTLLDDFLKLRLDDLVRQSLAGALGIVVFNEFTHGSS